MNTVIMIHRTIAFGFLALFIGGIASFVAGINLRLECDGNEPLEVRCAVPNRSVSSRKTYQEVSYKGYSVDKAEMSWIETTSQMFVPGVLRLSALEKQAKPATSCRSMTAPLR